jgi:hypothetical protein
MEYTSKNGQDIIDITIQNFGNIESGLFEMLTDNPGVNLNTNLTPGQKLTLNNENVGLIREKQYFKQRIFVINNADELQLNTQIGGFNSDFNNDFNNKTL